MRILRDTVQKSPPRILEACLNLPLLVALQRRL